MDDGSSGTNPLIPTWADFAYPIVFIGLVFCIVGLVALVRTRDLSAWANLLWAAAIVIAPIAGTVAFLVIRRRAGAQVTREPARGN